MNDERFSLAVFRLLLRCYPPAFRQEFGDEMVQTFRDLLQASPRRSWGQYAALWARTLHDIGMTALQERGETMSRRTGLLMGATVAGLLIAYVDSRPSWDDTGITAGTIFLLCVVLGAAQPRNAWQWALAVGIWIPLYAVLISHNYGAFLALAPAFLGAYIGGGLRFLFRPPTASI